MSATEFQAYVDSFIREHFNKIDQIDVKIAPHYAFPGSLERPALLSIIAASLPEILEREGWDLSRTPDYVSSVTRDFKTLHQYLDERLVRNIVRAGYLFNA